MANFNTNDRIKVKDRPDWPMPGGYKLTNLEGRVVEVIDDPEGYLLVLLDNEDATGIDKSIPVGFRVEDVEKI